MFALCSACDLCVVDERRRGTAATAAQGALASEQAEPVSDLRDKSNYASERLAWRVRADMQARGSSGMAAEWNVQ